jgi:ABC-type Mn2+/Zn2+ transport system ATPase subunit
MNAVELDHVTVVYGEVLALRDVSLIVPPATAVGFIGANGSGKSTLLKTIAGLLRPARGTVRVLANAPRRCPAATIAYVPQVEAVDWSFPATVRDVVSMGRFTRLPFYRFFGARDRALVDAAIARLGLSEFVDRRISALSGGQQQRVFLARALAAESELLLLDEPTTGVDAASEEMLREVVRELVMSGKTVLMTTHDLLTTGEWFDRVLVVDKSIVADGTPEEVSALDMDVACLHGHGHAVTTGRRHV